MIYFVALIAGIFASLGVGGGMVLIIYLTVFEDYSQIAAQGINLIYFIPIAILSVIIHSKNKLIEWKFITPSIICGIFGAVVGSLAALHFGSVIVRKVFALFILCIGIKELRPTRTEPSENSSS